MSSMWKDLLFLHGYLARMEDLLWSDQTNVKSAPEASSAETTVDKAATTDIAPQASKECTHRWPRLAAPH